MKFGNWVIDISLGWLDRFCVWWLEAKYGATRDQMPDPDYCPTVYMPDAGPITFGPGVIVPPGLNVVWGEPPPPATVLRFYDDDRS